VPIRSQFLVCRPDIEHEFVGLEYRTVIRSECANLKLVDENLPVLHRKTFSVGRNGNTVERVYMNEF